MSIQGEESEAGEPPRTLRVPGAPGALHLPVERERGGIGRGVARPRALWAPFLCGLTCRWSSLGCGLNQTSHTLSPTNLISLPINFPWVIEPLLGARSGEGVYSLLGPIFFNCLTPPKRLPWPRGATADPFKTTLLGRHSFYLNDRIPWDSPWISPPPKGDRVISPWIALQSLCGLSSTGPRLYTTCPH